MQLCTCTWAPASSSWCCFLKSHVRPHSPHAINPAKPCADPSLPCCYAGILLLYFGASVLVARLSSEVTKIGYERHMLFTNRFTECAPMRSV